MISLINSPPCYKNLSMTFINYTCASKKNDLEFNANSLYIIIILCNNMLYIWSLALHLVCIALQICNSAAIYVAFFWE